MVAGDSVLFKRGDRFSGSIIIQGKTGIYFGSYGQGESPLFWGNGATIGTLFMIRSSSNLIFNGFTISDTTISATDRTTQAKIQIAFTIEQTSRNNQFLHCKLDRIGYGFYITSTSPGQKIDGCDIGNLRMIRNTPTSINPDDDYGGVPVQLSSSNNIFTNNFLHDCWSQSYDYGYDGGGVEFFEEGGVIENNQIAYNTFYDCNGTFEHGSNSDGIANNPIRNNQIYYNKFINCSSLFYINNSGQYKTAVSNLQFYNNILVQNVASRTGNRIICSMATSESTQGIAVFKNNIFQVSNGASMMRSGQWTGGQLIHENNIYKISGGGTLNFTLSTSELNSTQNFWQNTTSSNPIDWDFHLGATTQPINFGQSVGLTRDFAGSVLNGLPDLGIYEYATTQITTNPLVASISVLPMLCYGGTTNVAISATGGTPPYAGTGTFTKVAGVYSYIISDATGARDTVQVVVTQPTAVSITASSGTITQNGGTTSITVVATGGTGSAYQYSLNGNAYQTTGIFSNVGAGTYTVSAKDLNGCVATTNMTITEPAIEPLVAAASTGSIMCNGSTTDVTITARGGVPPYTGIGNFTVVSGSYQYIVSDTRGSRDTVSVIVTQPSLIVLSLSTGSISTQGGNTSITAITSGGTSPYLFSINGGTYQTSNQFTGLSAGNYTVSVKDANGCLKSANTNIASPVFDTLKVTANVGTITCFGGTASVIVSAIGGNAPYTGTGTFFMSAGTRTFTVTDATGAISNVVVTLSEPSAILASVIVAGDVLTSGGTTSVTVAATGGVGPYLYSLDGGILQSSNLFSSVTAGNHTLSVKDQNGCIKIVSFTVNSNLSTITPLKLVVLSKSDVTCRGARDGKIEVLASGGRPPYQYAIGNGSYGIASTFSNLKAGTYRINVRDANQTIASVVVQILEGRRSCGRLINQLEANLADNSIQEVKMESLVYPNPSNSDFNLKINAGSNEEANVEVVDMFGKKLLQSKMRTNSSIRLGQQLKPGIYFVRVILNGKVNTTKIVKL